MLKVYLNRKLIVVETNLDFAITYWTKRKQLNNKITFKAA